jgi:hypothetical protein
MTLDPLSDDIERLVSIAERVLTGEPIESFNLGEYEIFVVTGYTQQAVYRDKELLTRRLNHLRDKYRNGRFWPEEREEEP